MILLIDNYDSFSYNVYQLLGGLYGDVRVVRNDAVTVEEIRRLAPKALVLSPGPGKPKDAGVCPKAAKELAGEIPILGICLGHQVICEAFGATVSYAKRLMHGKTSAVRRCDGKAGASRLLAGLPPTFPVGRYHSLAALPDTVPEELLVTAKADDGEIMAVEHKVFPVFGVQFHPESVMTPDGKAMLENFVGLL